MTFGPTEPTAEHTIEVSMPEHKFNLLNSGLIAQRGVTFGEMIEQDPRDAYKLVAALAGVVADTAFKVERNGVIAAAKEDDGEQATAGMAHSVLEETMPDIDTDPATVVLSVFGKRRLRDAIRGRKTPPIKVFTIEVEPPDLAF